MIARMVKSKPEGVGRRPFFSWENYRLLFDVVFWLMLTFTYAGYAVSLIGDDGGLAARYDMRLFGLLPGTLSFAAVAVAWHLLPWDLGVSKRRLLVVPVFLACVFWVNYSLITIDRVFYWPLFLMVFAHGVFLFGPKKSLYYAALVLLLVFVYLQLTGDDSVLSNIVLLVLISPSILFFITACAAIIEATERRREAQDLLAELRSAHAELRDYAGKVRELSISEERTRMAREIHDSVGHYLTVANVQLEAAGKLLDKSPKDAREQLERAKASASGALSEVRRSVRALKPLAVQERSGSGALAALAHGFEGAGPAVHFEVRGEERELPQEAELVLYRALQEGLTNALKHSDARRISARLSFDPEHVKLAVADDGKGAPEEAHRGGFGLSTLGQRVSALGGELRAANRPEGGFLLEIELPAERPDPGTP